MAIKPIKVINPAKPPARRAPRKPPAKKANPAPRARRPRRRNPTMKDDVVHMVAATAGGVIQAYVNQMLVKRLPEGAKDWSSLITGLLAIPGIVMLGRRRPLVRNMFLGWTGGAAAQAATTHGLVEPVRIAPADGMHGLGQVEPVQRIASILGRGPGRSQMDRMGYLSPGGPAQADTGMGYLSAGGPYQPNVETTDVY